MGLGPVSAFRRKQTRIPGTAVGAKGPVRDQATDTGRGVAAAATTRRTRVATLTHGASGDLHTIKEAQGSHGH